MALEENFSHYKTSPKVKEKDRFAQAINVVLNYWEIKPTQYEAKLQEIALRGTRDIAAFLPWAHVETDIHHSLKKFLKAAFTLKFRVRLYVMPELGVNYPNCGLPRDLLSKTTDLAIDKNWRVIYNHTAPNIFPLPSFSSPEVLKRFGSYLIKVGTILSEVFSECGTSDFCEIVVTNSFFNYYRGYGQKNMEHGDYSAAHVLSFREFVDKEYRITSTSSAVTTTTPGEAITTQDGEQFKMQLYETYNRHRYFAHVERLLREKTDLVFTRKGVMCKMRHIDLFNPECSPDGAYESLLTELFDFKPSIQGFYQKIIAGAYRGESIYLSNCGVFRRFSEQEKSFLMLASLIHSGEVSIMAEEWFKLSKNFERKLRELMRFLDSGNYVRQSRVSYISASKFSMEEKSFSILSSFAPGVVTAVSGLGAHTKSLSERLVFLDPKSIIRLYELIQLFSIAQSGKIVAVPAPMQAVANYMQDAEQHLLKFRKSKDPIRMNMGLRFEIFDYGLGQIVFYDPQYFWTNRSEGWSEQEKPDFHRFFQSILGLAEVNSLYSVSERRVQVASYVSQEDSTQRLLFIINPTYEEMSLKLSFPNVVLVSSLPQVQTGAIAGKSFELTVPALGVLSMQVSTPGQSDLDEVGEKILWT